MDNPKKEHKILDMIEREKDRSFWRRLNYVMCQSCNGSVQRLLVEEEQNRTLMEHIIQELVQEAIFDNIHHKRFFLAEAATACNGPDIT
jgi:hypothetical protein